MIFHWDHGNMEPGCDAPQKNCGKTQQCCTVKSITNINNKHQCYQQFYMFFQKWFAQTNPIWSFVGYHIKKDWIWTAAITPPNTCAPPMLMRIIPIQASWITPYNVLLVQIGAGSWLIPSIIIYLLFFRGKQTPLFSSTNQWEKDINDSPLVWSIGILSTAQLKIHQLPHVVRLQGCVHWFSK